MCIYDNTTITKNKTSNINRTTEENRNIGKTTKITNHHHHHKITNKNNINNKCQLHNYSPRSSRHLQKAISTDNTGENEIIDGNFCQCLSNTNTLLFKFFACLHGD